ncbi:MAG: efflux RND transporter periplasmic adaptor subunit [Verrucomicrobiales bacterium]|nr:efflux RND transporter periplasmic adaptor subunit [Verrucomicrobiales bacterium]
MTESKPSKVGQLRIDPSAKRRSQGTFWTIFLVVGILAVAAVALWRPWETETTRVVSGDGTTTTRSSPSPNASAASSAPNSTKAASGANATASSQGSAGAPSAPSRPTSNDGVVLTVSGYIINRERIELSPRFMGQVRWIGVKKGDPVTNGQVVVLLDDSEYLAQKREIEGRLDAAKVQVERTRIELSRVQQLAEARIETQRALDLARLDLASAEAEIKSLEGQLRRIDTWIDWTVIRSPINGVVLEKLVDPNELVTPQSFGGTRGPSTALISVGDPKDLQVEIDLNEADLSKVSLGQKCRVSPEAYLDRTYEGVVAEIAPEASRQKGTLQIKVQILNPDRFLTPELSAKVDFLAADRRSAAGEGQK